MAEPQISQKTERKTRTLEDEIAKQEAKLKRLQNDLREQKRREQERNAKAITALLQAEHLDQLPVETWQRRLPELKALLVESGPQTAATDEASAPAK